MNETLRTISERYSCRDFADGPLTEEQLDTILRAALAAPSGRNAQPWKIIVVTDKAFIDELDAEGMKIIAGNEDQSYYNLITSRGGRLLYNAPCLLMVVIDDSKYAPIDCGILVQNIALAAHALGLGSVICAMAGLALEGERDDEFYERLEIPDGYGFGMGVLIGTPNSSKPPHELEWDRVIRL